MTPYLLRGIVMNPFVSPWTMRTFLIACVLLVSLAVVPTGSAREECGYGPWESVLIVDTDCCADWTMGGCWNDKCALWATTVAANEVCVQTENIS